MKNTMTIAVLLSLMAAAGLAATDAYAQSNSERIVAIDERTSDIEDTTNDISDSVGSLATMVSAVQTTLADLATSIQGVVASISGVQTSVDGMAGDISTISSKISSMDSALTGISAIDARLTGIEAQIGSLQGSVDGIDTGDDMMTLQALAAIDSRLDATNSRINDVFDRLSLIETNLQITNQKIDTPPAPTTPPVGNLLLDGESELNVNTYHYIRHGDATTNVAAAYYELDMTFSCNKNVFLNQVDLVQVPKIGDMLDHVSATDDTINQNTNAVAEANDGGPVKATNNNYVQVDGRDLYNNAFHTGGSTYAELDVPVNFNNKLLRSGESLKFASVLHEGDFRFNSSLISGDMEYYGQLKGGTGDQVATDFSQLINGSTRDANQGLYEINVDWVASETGVTCSLNFGSAGATAPGLTSSSTLTYGVTTDKADADNALKDYRDTIDCSGDPVQINEITAGTTDDWDLAGFAKVILTIGSDTYTLKFDNSADTPILVDQDDVLPLYVGNQDLVISGSIAVENLLLSLKYDTIPNASCKQVPHAAYQ